MNAALKFAAACLVAACGTALSSEPSPDSERSRGTLAIDNYKLVYVCAGSASPTLVLEPPSGISAEEAFEPIFTELIKSNRVCFLERLGFGKSDKLPAGLTQTVDDYSNELLSLVKKASPEEKVIVVGYSFGGFISRYFAATHPDRVSGLLLIDSMQEDWLVEVKERMSPSDWSKMQDILDWFLRELGHNYWDSQFEVASVTLPKNLPVRIISRGLPYQRFRKANVSEEGFDIYNNSHNKHQFDLLRITNNTSRVVAEKSEHLIVGSEPTLVISEINKLVAEAAAASE